MSKKNFLKSATLAIAGLAVVTSVSSCSTKEKAHTCASKKEEKASCKSAKKEEKASCAAKAKHTCKGSKCSSSKR